MAAKTANVLARVEPEIKEKAETILSKLGIPASVVINMLYKQIIITKSIPFPLSLPSAPLTQEDLDVPAFDAIMQRGLEEVKADHSHTAADVFEDIRGESH